MSVYVDAADAMRLKVYCLKHGRDVSAELAPIVAGHISGLIVADHDLRGQRSDVAGTETEPVSEAEEPAVAATGQLLVASVARREMVETPTLASVRKLMAQAFAGGLTRAELSKLSGVSVDLISRIANGKDSRGQRSATERHDINEACRKLEEERTSLAPLSENHDVEGPRTLGDTKGRWRIHRSDCKTCESSHRDEIEARLRAGQSTRSVSAWLQETYGEVIRYDAIARHRKNHCEQEIEAAPWRADGRDLCCEVRSGCGGARPAGRDPGGSAHTRGSASGSGSCARSR